MIKNHELVLIIEMYDRYCGCDCFSLRYNPSMDSILNRERLITNGVSGLTMITPSEETINDVLTFNDFLPKLLKSARSQLQL